MIALALRAPHPTNCRSCKRHASPYNTGASCPARSVTCRSNTYINCASELQAEVEAVAACALAAATALTIAQNRSVAARPRPGNQRPCNALSWLPRYLASQHVLQRRVIKADAIEAAHSLANAAELERDTAQRDSSAPLPHTLTGEAQPTKRAKAKTGKAPRVQAGQAEIKDWDFSGPDESPTTPQVDKPVSVAPATEELAVLQLKLDAAAHGLAASATLAHDAQEASQGLHKRLQRVLDEHAARCRDKGELGAAALRKVAAAADALEAKPCEHTVKQLVRQTRAATDGTCNITHTTTRIPSICVARAPRVAVMQSRRKAPSSCLHYAC